MKFTKFVSRQRLSVVLLLAALVLLVCLLLFKAKAISYAKTEPYTINVSVVANTGSTVFLSYDYGYGIRDEHIRPLRLAPDQKLTREAVDFTLSVSAWKHIHALYFISPKGNRYTIRDLQIRRNGVSFTPSIPNTGPSLEGENWIYRLPLTDFDYTGSQTTQDMNEND